MHITLVDIEVEEEHVEEFIAATRANHEASVAEPGNIRFDVLQRRDDPARFLLYEVYESEEAARAHKETAHYQRWRDTVAPWMARPRQGVPYQALCPADRKRW